MNEYKNNVKRFFCHLIESRFTNEFFSFHFNAIKDLVRGKISGKQLKEREATF
jgi:hypothetical protein